MIGIQKKILKIEIWNWNFLASLATAELLEHKQSTKSDLPYPGMSRTGVMKQKKIHKLIFYAENPDNIISSTKTIVQ